MKLMDLTFYVSVAHTCLCGNVTGNAVEGNIPWSVGLVFET